MHIWGTVFAAFIFRFSLKILFPYCIQDMDLLMQNFSELPQRVKLGILISYYFVKNLSVTGSAMCRGRYISAQNEVIGFIKAATF